MVGIPWTMTGRLWPRLRLVDSTGRGVVVVWLEVASYRPSARPLPVGLEQKGRLGGCRRGPWSASLAL